jgi:hypothetical protein
MVRKRIRTGASNASATTCRGKGECNASEDEEGNASGRGELLESEEELEGTRVEDEGRNSSTRVCSAAAAARATAAADRPLEDKIGSAEAASPAAARGS